MNNNAVKQEFLDELHEKLILTDIKSRLMQTICNLINDHVYTKDEAVYDLLVMVAMSEMREK